MAELLSCFDRDGVEWTLVPVLDCGNPAAHVMMVQELLCIITFAGYGV